MHKVALIFSPIRRDDYFFHTRAEAESALKFYRRHDHFVDDTGKDMPIVDSYMMSFTIS